MNPTAGPRPETTLAVILGARAFADEDMNSPAFANSAERFREYLVTPAPAGFGAPAGNVLFDLFDSGEPPTVIVREMVAFLTRRSAELRAAGADARDLILYYVGHGDKCAGLSAIDRFAVHRQPCADLTQPLGIVRADRRTARQKVDQAAG